MIWKIEMFKYFKKTFLLDCNIKHFFLNIYVTFPIRSILLASFKDDTWYFWDEEEEEEAKTMLTHNIKLLSLRDLN